MVLSGDLAGQTLDKLALLLAELAEGQWPRVRLDLRGVSHMSVRAQVLLLAFARSMRRHGGEMVLSGAGPALRAEATWIDLFGQIRTIEVDERAAT